MEIEREQVLNFNFIDQETKECIKKINSLRDEYLNEQYRTLQILILLEKYCVLSGDNKEKVNHARETLEETLRPLIISSFKKSSSR